MTKSLLLSVAAPAALALAACAEDGQTMERSIDQDITATHYAGAAVLLIATPAISLIDSTIGSDLSNACASMGGISC